MPPLENHLIFLSSLTLCVKQMRVAVLQASGDGNLINELYLFGPFINPSEADLGLSTSKYIARNNETSNPSQS